MQARAAGSCDSEGNAYLLSGQKGLYPSQSVPGLPQVISRTLGPPLYVGGLGSCEENWPVLLRGRFNGSRWLQSGQAVSLAVLYGTGHSAIANRGSGLVQPSLVIRREVARLRCSAGCTGEARGTGFCLEVR